MQQLFEREVASGTLLGTDASRLEFFTAAEHALAIGTTNPCGLFVETVKSFKLRDDPPPDLPRKKRRWLFLTLSDEDSARARLQRFDGCSRPDPRGGGVEREQLGNNLGAPGGLSTDALTVGQLRRRFRDSTDEDILRRLQRECPEWTDRRWHDARTELATQHLKRSTDREPSSARVQLEKILGGLSVQGTNPREAS